MRLHIDIIRDFLKLGLLSLGKAYLSTRSGSTARERPIPCFRSRVLEDGAVGLLITDRVSDFIPHLIILLVRHLRQGCRDDRVRHLRAGNRYLRGIGDWGVLIALDPRIIQDILIRGLALITRRERGFRGVDDGTLLLHLQFRNGPDDDITSVRCFLDLPFSAEFRVAQRALVHELAELQSLRERIPDHHIIHVTSSHRAIAQDTAPHVTVILLHQDIWHCLTGLRTTASQPFVHWFFYGLTLLIQFLPRRSHRIKQAILFRIIRSAPRPIVIPVHRSIVARVQSPYATHRGETSLMDTATRTSEVTGDMHSSSHQQRCELDTHTLVPLTILITTFDNILMGDRDTLRTTDSLVTLIDFSGQAPSRSTITLTRITVYASVIQIVGNTVITIVDVWFDRIIPQASHQLEASAILPVREGDIHTRTTAIDPSRLRRVLELNRVGRHVSVIHPTAVHILGYEQGASHHVHAVTLHGRSPEVRIFIGSPSQAIGASDLRRGAIPAGRLITRTQFIPHLADGLRQITGFEVQFDALLIVAFESRHLSYVPGDGMCRLIIHTSGGSLNEDEIGRDFLHDLHILSIHRTIVTVIQHELDLVTCVTIGHGILDGAIDFHIRRRIHLTWRMVITRSHHHTQMARPPMHIVGNRGQVAVTTRRHVPLDGALAIQEAHEVKVLCGDRSESTSSHLPVQHIEIRLGDTRHRVVLDIQRGRSRVWDLRVTVSDTLGARRFIPMSRVVQEFGQADSRVILVCIRARLRLMRLRVPCIDRISMPCVVADGTPRATVILTLIKVRIGCGRAIVAHFAPTSGRDRLRIFRDQVTNQPIGRGFTALELFNFERITAQLLEQLPELTEISRGIVIDMLFSGSLELRIEGDTRHVHLSHRIAHARPCQIIDLAINRYRVGGRHEMRLLVPRITALRIAIQTDQSGIDAHRILRRELCAQSDQTADHLDHRLLV